jgi:hypothetical protein
MRMNLDLSVKAEKTWSALDANHVYVQQRDMYDARDIYEAPPVLKHDLLTLTR